jgi:hypothetical protein
MEKTDIDFRTARTCYDHLAGRLGTGIMASMIGRGILAGNDGVFDPAKAVPGRRSPAGREHEYWLTEAGQSWLEDFRLQVPAGSRRPLVRYCVDWTEQRHHLAGGLGAALLTRVIGLGWVRRSPAGRAVHVTDSGWAGLAAAFGPEVTMATTPETVSATGNDARSPAP